MLCLHFFACQVAAKSKPTQSQNTKKTSVVRRGFDGRIVSTNGIDLHAQDSSLSLGKWNFGSSWTKLTDVVPDGKAVKKGEVVARFDFGWSRLRDELNKQMQQTQAETQKALLDLEAELARQEAELERKKIEAQRALLEIQKGQVMSRRQLEMLQIDANIARFEADALSAQVVAQKKHIAKERVYYDHRQQKAKRDLKRYLEYEARGVLLAPEAGVIRHAYNRSERRKVQKGDGFASGSVVLSIALDKRLSVRFFVPETQVAMLKPNQTVWVETPLTDEDYSAVIRKVESFPQEMGFLKNDDQLANAREKACVVLADFNQIPSRLEAGNEVRVVVR